MLATGLMSFHLSCYYLAIFVQSSWDSSQKAKSYSARSKLILVSSTSVSSFVMGCKCAVLIAKKIRKIILKTNMENNPGHQSREN